ncbi:MAG: VCBS repeat-containing protein [Bacteroidetes bacterium]|nr:VCBS repeat-containing protein [Bacteroidota bacterium]
MNQLWVLFLLLVPFTGLSQNKLSVTDLKVRGTITDYHVDDLNGDSKPDILVSYYITQKNGQVNRYLALFLQTQGGYLAEPNQILIIDPEIIGYDLANLTGDEKPEIVLVSASTVEVGVLKDGLVLKESIKILSAISFFLQNPDIHHLPKLTLKNPVKQNGVDQLLILETSGLVLMTPVMKKNLTADKSYLSFDPPVSVTHNSSTVGTDVSLSYPGLVSGGSSLPQSVFLVFRDQIHWVRLNDFAKTPDKGPGVSVRFNRGENETVNIGSVSDLNNDDVPDVVVERRQPRDIITNRLSIDFYYGRADKNQFSLPATPDQRIVSEALVVDFELADLNNDNRTDVVVMEMSVSMGNFLSNLVNSDAKAVYKFHIQKNGKFSSTPSLEKDVNQQIDLNKNYFKPVFLSAAADFDGDGLPEILIKRSEKSMIAFGGSSSSLITASPVLESAIAVPYHSRRTVAYHLFDQRRQDLILTYGNLDSEGLRSVLRILSR